MSLPQPFSHHHQIVVMLFFFEFCSANNITGNKSELFAFVEMLANATYDNFENIQEYDIADVSKINIFIYYQLFFVTYCVIYPTCSI